MCADMQNVQQLACMQNVQQWACVRTCRMFNNWHVCNMLIAACGISIFEPGASTSRDSRTAEFRNLKAFRTIVGLFVDLVKFCTFSVNFEEGPFGRGLGTSKSEDSKGLEFRNLKAFQTAVSLFVDLVTFCTFSVNFEEGPFGRSLGTSRNEGSRSSEFQMPPRCILGVNLARERPQNVPDGRQHWLKMGFQNLLKPLLFRNIFGAVC